MNGERVKTDARKDAKDAKFEKIRNCFLCAFASLRDKSF